MTIDRDKLVRLFTQKAWKALGVADLDVGYGKLNNIEKKVIIDSLINEDDQARLLIKQKLLINVDAYAQTKADETIAAGTIPLDFISDKL